MKIDNRLFLPLIGPFALLYLMKLIFWLSGAEWSDPAFGAAISLFVGMPAGGIAAGILLGEKISLGHTRIFCGKDK